MSCTACGTTVRLGLTICLALALLLSLRGLPTAAAEGEESATVVREITSERTLTSKTLELSDGSRRALLFEAPIHYRDAQGAWQDLDTSLVSTGVFGEAASSATPATVTLGAEGAGAPPVTIAYEDAGVSFDLLGSAEAAPLVLAGEATYAGVAAATDLRYRVLPDGLKETLVLASAAAPDTFTFFVAHEGLRLLQGQAGAWGFYREGEKEPVFVLGDLVVFDSSVSKAGEPAYCEDATMAVAAAKGGSYVTYRVPRRWLEAAERVFPVLVDPTITLGQSVCDDTYVSSAYPSTAYGSDEELKVGRYDASTGWNRSLLKFDTGAVAGDYITDSHLRAYQHWQYYASTAKLTHIGRMTESWSEGSTWNGLDDGGGLEFVNIADQSVAREQWLDVACRTLTQRWANGESGYANQGFVVYQNADEGQTFWRKFRSSEWGTSTERPRMVVDYEEPKATVSTPAVDSAVRVGDWVTVTVNIADTANKSAVTEVRMGINRTAYPSDRVHGVMGWFRAKPAAPWVAVKKASGSWFAYYDSEAYGSDHITPDLAACTIDSASAPSTLTFRFRVNDNWGEVQDNDFDTYLAMTSGSTVWDSGWVARNRDVDVLPKPLSGTAATASPSAWYVEVDNVPTGGDGLADNPNCDVNDQGRADVTLTWDAAPLADGYQVYLWDGGAYQPVGRTLGNASTSWTTADLGFYPKDSDIAAAAWPSGAAGNPFYRAATPDDSAQTQLLQPSGYSGSAGLLAGDGTYLYARARSGQSGYTAWKKLGSGYGGTTAGQLYTMTGPDLAAKPALSAFCYNGRVYSGYVTKSGSTATISGVQTTSPYGDGGTITFSSLPLERSTGVAITASTHNVLLATDGTNIYNVAYTLTTSGGNPVYDGFKVRTYTMAGAFVSDTTISTRSFMLSHVLVDGANLYLGEWTGANGARVLKVAKSDGAVVNQWTHDQGTSKVCAGFYDATNGVFWLGHLTTNSFYKYAGPAGGLDPRDNPNRLYGATDGDAAWDAETSYRFCVVPYEDAAGEPSVADPEAIADEQLPVILPNRTRGVNDDPRHTSAQLGEWLGHSASAVVDQGGLSLTVTDLEIASWGPRAALARSYRSWTTAQSTWAPGWRFSFERKLELTSATLHKYTDETGDVHRFAYTNGAWQTPPGYDAIHSASGAEWKLLFNDESALYFDATGKLLREVDKNGNTVTYAWAGGDLTITAANGQSIAVDLNASGRVDAASYTTAVGTRAVDYTTAAPWQVRSYPNVTGLDRTMQYGFDAASRLTSVVQLDWPTTADPAWQFSYDANARLEYVYFPDYDAGANPDAKARITYDWANKTATVYRWGRVNDIAGTQVASETLDWADSGALVERTLASVGGEATTWDYTRGPGNEVVALEDPDGDVEVYAGDEYGNTTAVRDAADELTTASYDYSSDPTGRLNETTEPDGGETRYAYDANRNLVAETRLLSAADPANPAWARSEYSYDSWGRLTYEKQLVSGTVTENPDGSFTVANAVWAETDYDNGGYAASGEPLTTVHKAVKLSEGGAPQDLSVVRTYDAFGSLLTETDTSGTRVVVTNTYDLAGRLLTSRSAPAGTFTSGATQNYLYDKLGSVIEAWTSHSSTAVRADWTKLYNGTWPVAGADCGLDAMGRVTKEWHWLHDGTTATLQGTVTHSYDGRGLEYLSNDNTVGGQPAKTVYDARGNVTKQWGEGVPAYDEARAERAAYDAEGRETSRLEVGATSAATTSTYTATGELAVETRADGSWTSYAYDEAGNVVRETTPRSGYDPVTYPGLVSRTDFGYDEGARQLSQTDPDGQLTTQSYDLLDRVTGANGAAAAATTLYNSLGWVLREADGDGIATSYVYDSGGRVTSETRGTVDPQTGVFTASQSPTTFTYDEAGGTLTMTDPDNRRATSTYDCFGRAVEERFHPVGGADVRHTDIAYDSLGRPVQIDETVRGLRTTYAYPVNAEGGVTETERYDAAATVSTTVTRAARGVETQRETTVTGSPNVVVNRTTDARDAAERWTQATFATNVSANRSFDDPGRLVRQWGSGYAAGAATSDAYVYDPDTGRKSADYVQLAYGGTIDSDYFYDLAGRLEGTDSPTGWTSYCYDEQGNLASEEQSGVWTDYAYDAANRLTAAYAGRTGTPTTVYKWNTTQGWRTSQGPTDASQPLTFSYTSTGRLAGFSDATTGHVVSASFSYDAAGQRTQSAVTVNGTQTLTDYSYAGITLLRLSATQGTSTWQLSYLYDEEDAPYAGVYRSPASSTAPVVFAMVTTDRGDVVELLDTNGAPFCAYRYDPWGKPTSTVTQGTSLINSTLAAQIAARQVLRYAGYVYDSDIGTSTCGTYYLSARHYDPATRQFLSKDPAKADGEESAYQYCGGEPVGMVDPSGEYMAPPTAPSKWQRDWVRVWQPGHWVYHWQKITKILKTWVEKQFDTFNYNHLFKSATAFAIKMFTDLSSQARTWDALNLFGRPDAPVDSSESDYVSNWSELKQHGCWRSWIENWARLNQSQYWHEWTVRGAYVRYNAGHAIRQVFTGTVKHFVTSVTWQWVKWYHVNGKYALEVRWVRR
jgi:RHS repeat-associated protein